MREGTPSLRGYKNEEKRVKPKEDTKVRVGSIENRKRPRTESLVKYSFTKDQRNLN